MIPFQLFDIVDQKTFQALQTDIKRLLPHHIDMFLEPIFNVRNKRIGAFSDVCVRVQEIMIERGFDDPKINRIGVIKNNRTHVPFHLHPSLGNMNPLLREEFGKYVIPAERSYCAVYYCHDIHERKYQGTLGVKRHAEDTNGYQFPAIPNSLIIHNGTFGHDADVEELHPDISRSSCYTHWTTAS